VDPRIAGPGLGGKAPLSELMVAKSRAALGEKVNFCPFNCGLEDLDDLGYCEHLIGFTTDGKTLEPMVADSRGRKKVLGGKEHEQKVRPTDKLIRITVSSRVYREKKTEKAPA
jgi:hypothetical protein